MDLLTEEELMRHRETISNIERITNEEIKEQTERSLHFANVVISDWIKHQMEKIHTSDIENIISGIENDLLRRKAYGALMGEMGKEMYRLKSEANTLEKRKE